LLGRTLRFATIAFLLAAVAPLQGASIHATDDFSVVAEQVRSLVAEHGSKNVLLVCDIDNTLLAMKGDLGSDQWFEWQNFLLNNKPKSRELVAKDFDGLLAAQGLLFSLGKMRPPQADLPLYIQAMQADGVRTLVLTSRGEEFRIATERELRANGYDFAISALPTGELACKDFVPYDLDSIQASGLTAEEAALFGLKKPRPVSYSQGVYMTAGQHKGAMLLALLAKSEQQFKAVVFVDDHGRHVLRVFDALVRRGVDITAFHYQREDDNVKRFQYSDKKDVTTRWRRLDKTLSEVFE